MKTFQNKTSQIKNKRKTESKKMFLAVKSLAFAASLTLRLFRVKIYVHATDDGDG